MELREFVGFHSGINDLTFLLLYESTLLGKWLQTFRQTGFHVQKVKDQRPFCPLKI